MIYNIVLMRLWNTSSQQLFEIENILKKKSNVKKCIFTKINQIFILELNHFNLKTWSD